MKPIVEPFGDDARIITIRSTQTPPSDTLISTISDRRAEFHAARLEQQRRNSIAPTRLSAGTGGAVNSRLRQPEDEATLAWRLEQRSRIHEIRHLPRTPPKEINPPLQLDFRDQRVAGEGELWWAETSFILPNKLGFTLFWDVQGLRFSGAISHHNGDLWKGSIIVSSWFGLGRDRMPGGGTRFRSSPFGWLTGEVMGSTNDGGLLAGDQWSKCWLVASQVVHQGSLALPAWAPAWTLMHIEDDYSYDTNFLPGFISFPSIDFDLNRQLDVAVYTGLSFDFQLEGDADFRFGGIGHMNPSLFQGSQWRLQPL